MMYQLYIEGEIFLWCDGREEPVDKHTGKKEEL